MTYRAGGIYRQDPGAQHNTLAPELLPPPPVVNAPPPLRRQPFAQIASSWDVPTVVYYTLSPVPPVNVDTPPVLAPGYRGAEQLLLWLPAPPQPYISRWKPAFIAIGAVVDNPPTKTRARVYAQAVQSWQVIPMPRQKGPPVFPNDLRPVGTYTMHGTATRNR